jgi:hypothetical protein
MKNHAKTQNLLNVRFHFIQPNLQLSMIFIYLRLLGICFAKP